MRQVVPLIALLLLAACGSSDEAPAPAPAASGGGYVAKVAALSPKLRAGVLLRAVRDAERPCQQVVDQQLLPAPAAGAAWLATCEDKSRWVVAIADDGSATVTDAHDLAGKR